MKKYIKLIAAVLTILTAALSLSLMTGCSSGEKFVFELTESGEAILVDYRGRDKNVTVPAEWQGATVSSVGRYAFANVQSITSVELPESVTDIGDFAFAGCKRLESVTFPEGGVAIGRGCFSGCIKLTAVELQGVDAIPDLAFADCASLTSVTGGRPRSIGSSAFKGCSSLTDYSIPDTVESLGDEAFAYCGALRSISIGTSV